MKLVPIKYLRKSMGAKLILNDKKLIENKGIFFISFFYISNIKRFRFYLFKQSYLYYDLSLLHETCSSLIPVEIHTRIILLRIEK